MQNSVLFSRLAATALLFPGQGSQEVGMAKDVADHYPVARATLAEADEALGFPLSRLMFEGPEAVLTDTINAQPALLACSIAILRAIGSELGGEIGTRPGVNVFVAGHSMGEYAALVAAGSISYADGLRLVRERGRLMQEAGKQAPGMMAAVLGLDETTVATVCEEATLDGGIAQVANDNCPGQIVISGDVVGMERAMTALAASGAKKVVPLAVSIAAHSPLMRPAAAALEDTIQSTAIGVPIVPIIANMTADALVDPVAIRQELVAQLTGSVRWTGSIQRLVDAGVGTFVEIGSGEVLSGLVKRIARSANRLSVQDSAGLRRFVDTLVPAP